MTRRRTVNPRLLKHKSDIYRKTRQRNEAGGMEEDYDLHLEDVSCRFSMLSNNDVRAIEHDKKKHKDDMKVFYMPDIDIIEGDKVVDNESNKEYDVTRVGIPSERGSHKEVYLSSRG